MNSELSLVAGTLYTLDLLVASLLIPVVIGLVSLVALALWETGTAAGERFAGIRRMVRAGQRQALARAGRNSIDRADLLARIGPMLGLMGTLIPLGPGLAALANGQLDVLAQAVTVAFNTTVLGLLIGIVGFMLGRLRRRWFDAAMMQLESGDANT